MIVTSDTFGRRVERLARIPERVVDLETTGLRIYQGDRLFSVAVLADGEEDYFPFRHQVGRNLPEEKLPVLLDVLTAPGSVIGGHNFIRFDVPMLAREGERYRQRLLEPGGVRKWDTIVDALLTNENELSFSLDYLGRKYLGEDAAAKHSQQADLMTHLRRLPNGARQAVRSLKGRMAELPPEVVAPYALGDVRDTWALRVKYLANLQAWGLERLAEEMYDFARLLAKIEARGLRVDLAECERRIHRIDGQAADVLSGLRRTAGVKFNPNAPKQVMALCGTEDAEADTLRRSGHPLAGSIIEYKRLLKMKATYYQNMIERADADGIIHPQMNLTRDPRDQGGTRSGRLSCSNPNFQNLPKRSPDWYMQVRDVVLARPGHVLNPNDYERAEMWMGAHYSRDESLYDAYHAGRDLYLELAERTETDRQGAKIDWLSIQYGVGAAKLSRMNGRSWPFKPIERLERECGKPVAEWGNPEWETYFAQKGPAVKRAFFQLCPGIKDQMNTIASRAETTGYLRLWTGRVIHFDGHYTRPYAGWNRLIQGGVGEMVRIAMQRLEPMLDHYEAGMVLQVHDEVVNEIPDQHVGRVIAETKDVMEEFPEFWLRPRVEPNVGVSYGHVSKYLQEAA